MQPVKWVGKTAWLETGWRHFNNQIYVSSRWWQSATRLVTIFLTYSWQQLAENPKCHKADMWLATICQHSGNNFPTGWQQPYVSYSWQYTGDNFCVSYLATSWWQLCVSYSYQEADISKKCIYHAADDNLFTGWQ